MEPITHDEQLRADIANACNLNALVRNTLSKSEAEINRLIKHIDALNEHVARVENHANHISARYETSISWRITKPLRFCLKILKTIRNRIN